MSGQGIIRAGIGGWTFEPWRGVFYPEKLTQAKELAFASRAVTSIEINGTYYGSQKPATFVKWASEVPDDFVFSLKGPRFATNRRVLAEAGDSIKRFLESGPTLLGSRLGPILWQFAPTKKFDEADFGAFLALLPKKFDGAALRHAVEVRHDTFKCEAFITLLRRFDIPVVYADHPTYPAIADPVGDFVYARLQKGEDDIPTGYPPKAIADWAEAARSWASGRVPKLVEQDLAAPVDKATTRPRDVFVYFIHGGKVRAPAAAQAFIGKTGTARPHADDAAAAPAKTARTTKRTKS